MSSTPTPLDVMVRTMHEKWQAGDSAGAVALAKIVAPYFHPKPTGIPRAVDWCTMKDEELNDLCEVGGDGTRLAPTDTQEPD